MKQKNGQDPTKTVLTITVGFLIIYAITGWKWALPISIGVGIIGMFSTYLSEKIDFLWMKLSWLLSLIVPNIILSIIFFLFLFPIALLSRLFGEKDALNIKNKGVSTFKNRDKVFDKPSFEKPW